MGRQELADAVAGYYQVGEEDGLYSTEVGGERITLSILSKPEWRGLNTDLQTDGEESNVAVAPGARPADRMNSVVYESAIARLADAEVNNRVLINNPMFRLNSAEVVDGKLHTSFGMATFADYALRTGLMEIELVDSLLKSDGTPVRDVLLPSLETALDLNSYFCTGGPVALFAVADQAGPPWPELARAAALFLTDEVDSDESIATQLLADCRVAFAGRSMILTDELLSTLKSDLEAPWATYGPNGLSPRSLAKILKEFGIGSLNLRQDGTQSKGYRAKEFIDAWARYLQPDVLIAPGDEATPVGNVRPIRPSRPRPGQGTLDEGREVGGGTDA